MCPRNSFPTGCPHRFRRGRRDAATLPLVLSNCARVRFWDSSSRSSQVSRLHPHQRRDRPRRLQHTLRRQWILTRHRKTAKNASLVRIQGAHASHVQAPVPPCVSIFRQRDGTHRQTATEGDGAAERERERGREEQREDADGEGALDGRGAWIEDLKDTGGSVSTTAPTSSCRLLHGIAARRCITASLHASGSA